MQTPGVFDFRKPSLNFLLLQCIAFVLFVHLCYLAFIMYPLFTVLLNDIVGLGISSTFYVHHLLLRYTLQLCHCCCSISKSLSSDVHWVTGLFQTDQSYLQLDLFHPPSSIASQIIPFNFTHYFCTFIMHHHYKLSVLLYVTWIFLLTIHPQCAPHHSTYLHNSIIIILLPLY